MKYQQIKLQNGSVEIGSVLMAVPAVSETIPENQIESIYKKLEYYAHKKLYKGEGLRLYRSYDKDNIILVIMIGKHLPDAIDIVDL
ncbi:MAG: hypothetical protein LBO69_09810 [Ignavibacteria bacterium]|jgi:hypothetical protein|nr:hypothetical protein [Ignavibacteria bacterium]